MRIPAKRLWAVALSATMVAAFPVSIYDVWNDAFNDKHTNIQVDYLDGRQRRVGHGCIG